MLEYEDAVRGGKVKAPSMDFSARFEKALEMMRMMDEILADVSDAENGVFEGQEIADGDEEEDEDGWLLV